MLPHAAIDGAHGSRNWLKGLQDQSKHARSFRTGHQAKQVSAFHQPS